MFILTSLPECLPYTNDGAQCFTPLVTGKVLSYTSVYPSSAGQIYLFEGNYKPGAWYIVSCEQKQVVKNSYFKT